MATFLISFTVLPLAALLLLFSNYSLVLCSDDDENTVLQGVNSYRTSQNLPALTKNDKAGCVADELANRLEDQRCTATNGVNAPPANDPRLSNYPDILSKCKLDVNTTVDGAIMPVCVRNLVPTLVLTNYTRTRYARYLNDTRFTGFGVGSEDDWMVMVLTTNSRGGSFVSAAAAMTRGATRSLVHHYAMLLFSTSIMFLVLV